MAATSPYDMNLSLSAFAIIRSTTFEVEGVPIAVVPPPFHVGDSFTTLFTPMVYPFSLGAKHLGRLAVHWCTETSSWIPASCLEVHPLLGGGTV